jgi:hypothetical protein
MDELLDLRVAEALAGLELPREDPCLGHPLIKDMGALLLAKGDEEQEVFRPIRYGDDAVQAPRPTLGGKGRVRREDVVDLLARIVVLEHQGWHRSVSLRLLDLFGKPYDWR